MATITLQLYLTDTLTAVTGVSLAAWASDDSSVIDSGVTDGNGQLDLTLSTSTTYNIHGFLTGYSFTESSITTGLVDATFTVYCDAVPSGAKTYSFYKDDMVNTSTIYSVQTYGLNITFNLPIFKEFKRRIQTSDPKGPHWF